MCGQLCLCAGLYSVSIDRQLQPLPVNKQPRPRTTHRGVVRGQHHRLAQLPRQLGRLQIEYQRYQTTRQLLSARMLLQAGDDLRQSATASDERRQRQQSAWEHSERVVMLGRDSRAE